MSKHLFVVGLPDYQHHDCGTYELEELGQRGLSDEEILHELNVGRDKNEFHFEIQEVDESCPTTPAR
jgi:hypothetical protein